MARPSRRHVLALAAAAAGAIRTRPAQAQAWPARAITLVVPYTAGGSSDIGARLLNGELGRQLGQNVVVDNVGGAAGALGVQKVVRAPADGHTLLMGSLSECLLVPLANPAAGYKPEDLLPVALTGASPAVFVTRADFPAQTIDEFIALARRNPGRYTYGSPGVGTFQHVMGETFKARAGLFMVHIPYRGAPQVLQDVMGGQIDLGITTIPSVAGFVASGKMKVLGVSTAARHPALKTAQAFGESAALKGLELSTWAMVYAPAGTPEAVAQKLNATINAISTSPAMVEARTRLGGDLPAVLTLAQARAWVQAEREKYAPVIKGLKLE